MVLETDRRPKLRGMFGTIEHRFGNPEHLALDVRLDDGRLELFWPHGLESAEEAEKVFRARALVCSLRTLRKTHTRI